MGQVYACYRDSETFSEMLNCVLRGPARQQDNDSVTQQQLQEQVATLTEEVARLSGVGPHVGRAVADLDRSNCILPNSLKVRNIKPLDASAATSDIATDESITWTLESIVWSELRPTV